MPYTLIFLLKNVSSFCICKSYSHFFQHKNTCDLGIVLTKTVNLTTNGTCCTNDALNNWAQIIILYKYDP